MSITCYFAVLNKYFKEYNIQPFNVNIMEVTDMDSAYFELRPDQIGNNSRDSKRYNGFTVPPLVPEEPFTILLNKQRMQLSKEQKNYEWIGTIVHEGTHVDDFQKYYAIVSAHSYDELYDCNKHRMFNCWTEFHARFMGQVFVQRHLIADGRQTAQEKYVLDTELPRLVEWYIKSDGDVENDGDMRLYLLMQLLGILSAWQKCYPNTFTKEVIHSLFWDEPSLEELYYFLNANSDIDEVTPRFGEMHDILKKSYPYMP